MSEVTLNVPNQGICRYISLRKTTGKPGYGDSVRYTVNASKDLKPGRISRTVKIDMPTGKQLQNLTESGEGLKCKLTASSTTGNLQDAVIEVDPATDPVSRLIAFIRHELLNLIPVI